MKKIHVFLNGEAMKAFTVQPLDNDAPDRAYLETDNLCISYPPGLKPEAVDMISVLLYRELMKIDSTYADDEDLEEVSTQVCPYDIVHQRFDECIEAMLREELLHG